MDEYQIKQRQEAIKAELLSAIWQDPNKIIPLNWTLISSGKQWQTSLFPDGTEGIRNKPDRTVLKQPFSGSNNICVYCNGDFGALRNGSDIFSYLQYLWNTNEFPEVIARAGAAYGIDTDIYDDDSPQTQRRHQRAAERQIIAEIARYITAALRDERGKAAREYLVLRGLADGDCGQRLGAWNSSIKNDLLQQLRQEFADENTDAIVRRFFPTARKDFASDPAGVWHDFADDYQLAIPYTNGSGNVTGFALRRTAQRAVFTGANGVEAEMPKYLYSSGIVRNGYCEALQGGGTPVILVEGLLDAEAMKQHGFKNVMALGGQTPTDSSDDPHRSAIQTLLRFNAKHVIYVPDYEYKDVKDAAGNVIGKEEYPTADATLRTIDALLPHVSGQLDAAGFVSLKIADLELPDAKQAKTKVDADAFLHDSVTTDNDMQCRLDTAVQWYEFKLEHAARTWRDPDELSAKAIAIYTSMGYAQRERLKSDITQAQYGWMADIRKAGVTAAVLSQIDKDGESSTWQAQMREIADDIGKARTRERMAELLTRAQRVQNSNASAAFDAQINITREAMHKKVSQKPDYLEMPWDLYGEKDGEVFPYRKISFTPAAVSIIAAPTNHGKTLLLLDIAVRLAKAKQQKFLYLSFENDQEQLYVRALAAYMGGKWAANEPNPRSIIRTAIRENSYSRQTSYSGMVDIDYYEDKYWTEVRPNLELIHMESDIDAVVNNIEAQVAEWRQNGINVGGIFIDYLQKLQYPSLHAFSRTDILKGVCDRLNEMAKCTKLPVIAAAQFNREAISRANDGLDGVELANIGESAGIENIAEDAYLLWQTDKIKLDTLKKGDSNTIDLPLNKYRTRRCFGLSDGKTTTTIDSFKKGCLYIECLKGRDYSTGGYCFLQYNGAAGAITSEISEK